MLRRSLVVLVSLATACGDDGSVGKLPDAPLVPDSIVDAPDDGPPLPPKDVPLDVTTSGNGSGRITSSPAGIDCGSTCSFEFDPDTVVTLTAEPDVSSEFTGWGGACSGTTPVCEVTIADATSVTATFTLKQYDVTVTKAGGGSGTVTGNGINCGTGAGCTITVDHGTAISLTATPENLNVFVGWGGACTGTSTCDLTITAATSISAAFALDELAIITSFTGNGAGTVTSSPAGINCTKTTTTTTGTCEFVYTANQMVTLTAAPAASSTFTGWSGGGCSGTGTCVVTMDMAKAVTAGFTLKQYVLQIDKTGTGTGTVTSAPAGIACGGDCDETYNHGTAITLTAVAATGSTFTGWSGGGCSSTGTCVVTLAAATTVQAQFTINSYALTTSTTAGGTITSTPGSISCPTTCAQNFTHGTVVTLTPTASTGYTFTSWGGACSGNGACMVTMTQARNVTATFTINSYNLDVTVTGMGQVTHSTQIDCPSDCQGTYTHGTNVTLTQTAATGYTFAGWGGACSSNGACTVPMTQARSVTATFTINSYTLTTAIAGTGSGVVSAPNISCPGDCTENFTHGTNVTVTQVPNADSNFVNWTGACTGNGACVVPMTQARSVTANYAIKTYNLDVTVTGNGSVRHTGQIDCPTDCQGTYNHGTSVTLTQTAAAGYRFTGWGGACMGPNGCTVDMTAMRSVSATFTPEFALNVTIAGSTGTVTSNIAGISCPTDCSETYLNTQTVVLTAAPTGGSTFSSWSGCSSVAGNQCTVAMTQARNVTATFAPPSFVLTVEHGGNGYGRVTASTIINCANSTPVATDCTETLVQGSTVTLTAVGATNTNATETSFFSGWSGACTGTGTCTVSMDMAKSVTANWELYPNVMFVTSTPTAIFGTGWRNTTASICKSAVERGGLNGVGPGQNTEWVAWVSGRESNGTIVNAKDLLVNAAGWVRTDGRPVFQRVSDIASHEIIYPPRLDETGADVGLDAVTWTGTDANGNYSTFACNAGATGSSWANNDNATGTQGLASANSAEFTSLFNVTCAGSRRIYCMGADRLARISVTRRAGRLAFTSKGVFRANPNGINEADTLCKSEATEAGLPNASAFRALLATQGASAMSRFPAHPSDAPWVRVGDQQPLTRRESDMRNAQLVALDVAPNVHASGQRIGNVPIWTGAQNLTSVGNSSGTCGNWTNLAEGKGASGFAYDTGIARQWFGANYGTTPCEQAMRVVCLESLQ